MVSQNIIDLHLERLEDRSSYTMKRIKFSETGLFSKINPFTTRVASEEALKLIRPNFKDYTIPEWRKYELFSEEIILRDYIRDLEKYIDLLETKLMDREK